MATSSLSGRTPPIRDDCPARRHDRHLKAELLKPQPAPPPSRPWHSVTYDVEGGQPIQAWLSLPEGEGPFPTVIETHGGPEAATMESFSPRGQVWTDHGYAYFSINYRGSTTFGREFKESIWGHPGELEVRDIVAGRQWLVERGIAIPDQVFLTGWSYGGFLTLHGLGTAPGLWAGGMAGIAVADWVSEYEDENDALRAYDRALFGGTAGREDGRLRQGFAADVLRGRRRAGDDHPGPQRQPLSSAPGRALRGAHARAGQALRRHLV